MTAILKDLRHAIRVLGRTKGWTAVVLLSLALGIGANTALFTAMNGILLQTLEVPHPGELVRLKWMGQNDMTRSSSDYGFSELVGGQRVRATVSYAIYQQFRAANQTMVDLTAFAPGGNLNVVIDNQAEFASSLEASGSFFRTLQLNAVLGRTFTDADDTLAASPVAVISDAYWRKRFGADPHIVNRVVTMNNQQVTIVGVLPASFTGVTQVGSTSPDIIWPLAFDGALNQNQKRMSEPTSWWLLTIGRLKPGATIDQVRGNLDGPFRASARAGLDAYQNSLTAEQKQLSTNRARGSAVPALTVSSAAHGSYDLDTTTTQSAQVLSVVVVIVLLIVCANVANLLLSRATSRQREISIRLSMGATRSRLIRQLLTESLLLSCLGGLLGILVGYWSRALLPFGQDTPVDWRVVTFVAGLSLLTGLAFGLAPALRATRVDLAGSMKESGRSVIASRSWLSRGLLVVQVALSLLLLVGAGLFLRTLDNLRHVDVGFNPTNLLMFRLNPTANRYDQARIATLYDDLQTRLAAVPGIRSVALTRTMLLAGSTSSSSIWVQGVSGPKPTEGNMFVMTVSPAFFETMGIPVLEGRAINDRDTATSPKVVVINESAARELFPHESAIGHRLGNSIEQNGQYEIVGVCHDTKYSSIRDAVPPTTYYAYKQTNLSGMAVVARTATDPSALGEAVRAAVRQVDPALPVAGLTTQADQLEQRFKQEKLFAMALSLFGALALILACIGLFGLMSYNVGRRTNEIGIRMALGAQRWTVIGMVLSESMWLVGIGLAIGLVTSVAVGRFVKAVLFGLAVGDVPTFALATLLVLIVSLLAGFVPARRASRVDPMVALHQQ
jgi:predicted permease